MGAANAAGLVDGSTGWILGWTLAHSVWQAALVAAGLALVFRFVPGTMARLRRLAAWGAFLLVVALAAATWLLVGTEWRGHAACWDSEEFARENLVLCASHAVPAARTLLGDRGKLPVVSPLAWVRRIALPVPSSVRSASLALTGGVTLVALVSTALALGALFRLAVSLGLLRGILRRARPIRRPELDELLGRLARELGVARRVELRESDEISTPAVAGLRHAVILVPRGMADVLAPAQLADVLAHELVHVRERHFAVNLGQLGLDCLCVFNPFALWISRRIREEREVHCDRVAAGPPAAGRRRYARTLLELEHLRGPASPALIGLVSEGSLLRRIRRLMDTSGAPTPGRFRRAAVAGATVFGTVVIVAHVSMTMVALTSWAVMSHDIDLRRAAAAAATATSCVAETAPSAGESATPIDEAARCTKPRSQQLAALEPRSYPSDHTMVVLRARGRRF